MKIYPSVFISRKHYFHLLCFIEWYNVLFNVRLNDDQAISFLIKKVKSDISLPPSFIRRVSGKKVNLKSATIKRIYTKFANSNISINNVNISELIELVLKNFADQNEYKFKRHLLTFTKYDASQALAWIKIKASAAKKLMNVNEKALTIYSERKPYKFIRARNEDVKMNYNATRSARQFGQEFQKNKGLMFRYYLRNNRRLNVKEWHIDNPLLGVAHVLY